MPLKSDPAGLELASKTSDICVSYSNDQDDTLVGISFAGHHEVSVGIKLDINYYGSDEGHFLSHLQQHLKAYLKQLPFKDFNIFVRFPIRFSFEINERVLSKYFGKRFPLTEEDHHTTYIFTKSLKQNSKV